MPHPHHFCLLSDTDPPSWDQEWTEQTTCGHRPACRLEPLGEAATEMPKCHQPGLPLGLPNLPRALPAQGTYPWAPGWAQLLSYVGEADPPAG
jgi:hypothetical protein